jgi:hypothetical protein
MDMGNKDRKRYLARRKLIKCSLCPYHRRENITKSKPRSDKYKSKRRGK